jgi:hypothetical protein
MPGKLSFCLFAFLLKILELIVTFFKTQVKFTGWSTAPAPISVHTNLTDLSNVGKFVTEYKGKSDNQRIHPSGSTHNESKSCLCSSLWKQTSLHFSVFSPNFTKYFFSIWIYQFC